MMSTRGVSGPVNFNQRVTVTLTAEGAMRLNDAHYMALSGQRDWQEGDEITLDFSTLFSSEKGIIQGGLWPGRDFGMWAELGPLPPGLAKGARADASRNG